MSEAYWRAYDAKVIEKQAMLEAVVKQLGEPRDAIHVVLRGKQANGHGRPLRDRTIRVDMSGGQAQGFLADPTFDAIWAAFGAYLGEGVGDDEEAIEVESVTITERQNDE